MSIIENKEDMISYFKLKKKIEKKQGCPKITHKFVKNGKNW